MSMWYDLEKSDTECIFTYIKFRTSSMVHLEQTDTLDCIVGVNCWRIERCVFDTVG